MKYYLAVTDNEWFEYLRHLKPDEVNFWRPGGQQGFAALEPGGLFLFKLHAPLHFIVGGGYFIHYTRFPLSIVWRIFELKNGAPEFSTFSQLVFRHRREDEKTVSDPVIGCIILTEPFFFGEQDWIKRPHDFALNIVQRKTYDSNEPNGAKVWRQVDERLTSRRVGASGPTAVISDQGARYVIGTAKHRLGQSGFRAVVTNAYRRRCAISGEKTLPVLEASHIRPFSQEGPNELHNGILLRADLHNLFDAGYVTLTKDYDVEVSKRIKEDFDNGRNYYEFHGKRLIVLPENTLERSSKEFIPEGAASPRVA